MEAPKKPGRPAKLGVAQSGKQRATMYRTRRYEAASMAHENLSAATIPVLLAALARQLKAVADSDHEMCIRDRSGAVQDRPG